MRTLYRNSNGTIPRKGVGGLGCCCSACCEDGNELKVAFHNVNWCPCVQVGALDVEPFTTLYGQVVAPFTITGLYTLANTGAGTWSGTSVGGIEIAYYDNGSCVAEYPTTVLLDLKIDVTCTYGAYTIEAYIIGSGVIIGGATSIFSGIGGLVINNVNDCSGQPIFLGSLGTATLTCVPP